MNRKEKIPTEQEVDNYFLSNTKAKHMINRLILAKTLNIPVYLISMENNFEKCQVLEFKINNSLTDFNISYFNNQPLISLNDLNALFNNLRNEQRTNPKPLSHISNVDLISKFNSIGINLGGNLDGFYIDTKDRKFHLIEFSKIGAKKTDLNGQYTLNYNFNRFMNQDFGRWHALEILRSEIEKRNHNVQLDVIVWSLNSQYMKIIREVKFKGERNKYLQGIFKEEELYSNNVKKLNLKF